MSHVVGWVAKLIERPLAQHTGYESKHPSNIIKRARLVKELPAHIAGQKIYKKDKTKKFL